MVLDREQPDRLVAARIGSPVVLGIGEGESWVASDALALRPYTERMVVLEDGEVAELTARGFKTVDLDSRDRDKRVEKILHQAEAAELGDYAHYMLKEIYEQPEAIDRSHARPAGCGDGLVAPRRPAIASGAAVRRAAGRVFWLRHQPVQRGGRRLPDVALRARAGAGRRTRQSSPCRTRSSTEDPVRRHLAERRDRRHAGGAARDPRCKGGLVAGVTNVVGSSLARETDFGTYVHAGPEISVCSTKAFTAQVLATELLALQFARMRDLSATDGRAWVKALEQLPGQVRVMLEQSAEVPALRRALRRREVHHVHRARRQRGGGRRRARSSSRRLPTCPPRACPGAAMKHGPLALIEPGLPVWALVPPDETRERMLGNLRELKARGAYITAVADPGRHARSPQLVDEVIQLPPHHPAVSPILTVIPLQLYAYYSALTLGYDIDKPRNLAKSVTVM